MRIRLREHRDRLGLTLEDMEERCRFSYSQLSRWETGDSNIPSSNLPELALAYACLVTEIFGDDDEAGGQPNEDRAIERQIVRASFALSHSRKRDALRIIEGFREDDQQIG